MHKWGACLIAALIVALPVFGQQSPAPAKSASGEQSAPKASSPKLQDLLGSNVKTEWEAFKTRKKQPYFDLLAEDFVAVESDGEGERHRYKAADEVERSNVDNYLLTGLSATQLGPDAAYVNYEVTLQFPPKSVIRMKRFYITEIWRLRDGQWKLWRYQETAVK